MTKIKKNTFRSILKSPMDKRMLIHILEKMEITTLNEKPAAIEQYGSVQQRACTVAEPASRTLLGVYSDGSGRRSASYLSGVLGFPPRKISIFCIGPSIDSLTPQVQKFYCVFARIARPIFNCVKDQKKHFSRRGVLILFCNQKLINVPKM